MRQLLLASVAALALSTSAASAAQFTLPDNPTSVTGNFSMTPGAGAFEDQVIFELTGGPAYLTIANATNTFAAPSDFITGWLASIWYAGADGIVNNGIGDVLLFGPQAAAPCIGVPNCQQVGGSGVLPAPGVYYAEFTGTGGGTSGYSGNISTTAVPGPLGGAGLLPLLGLLGFAGWRRFKGV
jgi:hypothetical protein